jgi:hypothetical protein
MSATRVQFQVSDVHGEATLNRCKLVYGVVSPAEMVVERAREVCHLHACRGIIAAVVFTAFAVGR